MTGVAATALRFTGQWPVAFLAPVLPLLWAAFQLVRGVGSTLRRPSRQEAQEAAASQYLVLPDLGRVSEKPTESGAEVFLNTFAASRALYAKNSREKRRITECEERLGRALRFALIALVLHGERAQGLRTRTG